MLKAWSNRNQFQVGSNLKAWLFTILRNQYYSELRHRKFEVEDPDGVCAATLSVAPDHDQKLELQDLSRALGQLPEDQREALLLVCASGLSYEQAAQVCDCAVGTIKSRIARGRDRLVVLLGEASSRLTQTLSASEEEDEDDSETPVARAEVPPHSEGVKRFGTS